MDAVGATVHARCLEVLQGQLGITAEEAAEIGLDEDLDELGVDSLEAVEIIMATEEEFEIDVPEDVFDGGIRTLRQAEALVARLVEASK